MSRIGKKPIEIPKGVTVSQNENFINVKGPKGELQQSVHSNIKIEINKSEVVVSRPDDSKENKSLHGLTRALIQNMVTGVDESYKKTLDIVGVGYRAELKGKNLLLN
ncbi:MAG: 50S ribosomal protein L6, partial [Ignavibacterium sp.]